MSLCEHINTIDDAGMIEVLKIRLNRIEDSVRLFEHRAEELEARIGILVLENAKLKFLLEDICYEVSKDTNKPKTRRKS